MVLNRYINNINTDIFPGSGTGSSLDIPIIIAIVVGVILAAMILGAICICCFIRRGRHHHHHRERVLADPPSETTDSVTEVPVHEMDPAPKHVLVPVAGYPAEPADYSGFGSDYVLYKGHADYDRPTHLWRPIWNSSSKPAKPLNWWYLQILNVYNCIYSFTSLSLYCQYYSVDSNPAWLSYM